MKLTTLLIAIAAVLVIQSDLKASGPIPLKINVGGVERDALVFLPSMKTAKAPLILAFHGHGGNAKTASHFMGLQNIWPEAIVVYPQGLPTKTTVDPQGLKPGWQISPGQNGDRDLKFVDEILTHLHQKFSIDDRRIYGTGFSNGGRFSYILWAQRPNLFAVFGICAGLIREPVRLTEPKPLLHIAGEKDEVAPFQVQQQTIAIARQINGCSDQGEPCGQGCTLYPSSKNAPVEVIIHHGGHIYPPAAPALIVRFFQQHGAPPSHR